MTLEDYIKENTAAVKENTAMLAQILAASERTTLAAPKKSGKAKAEPEAPVPAATTEPETPPAVEDPAPEEAPQVEAPQVEAPQVEAPQAEAPPADTVEADGPITEDDAVKLRVVARAKLAEGKKAEFEALRTKFGIDNIQKLLKSQLKAFTEEFEKL